MFTPNSASAMPNFKCANKVQMQYILKYMCTSGCTTRAGATETDGLGKTEEGAVIIGESPGV